MIEVRPAASDADAELFVALRNEIHPREPISVELFAAERSRPRRLDLLAWLDGEPVGVATAGEHWVDPAGPELLANVRVRRDARRRGVGAALFAALSEHARAHGCSGLYTVVPADDADSLDYLAARGFERVLEMQGVALDLAAVEPSDPVPPADLELRRIEPALDRAVYEAAVEVEQDLEAHEQLVPLDYERWRERQFERLVRRDLSFAALDRTVVAGYAILDEPSPGIGEHSITAVRRSYRGRGLARALKRAQVAAAKAAGLRELRASNTIGNAAMRRINAELGYLPTFRDVHLLGPLS